VQRLETALLGTLPERCVGARRPSDALEVLRVENLEFKQIAQQLARALSDDDVVEFSDALKPSG
jgi:hypothetical protein